MVGMETSVAKNRTGVELGRVTGGQEVGRGVTGAQQIISGKIVMGIVDRSQVF